MKIEYYNIVVQIQICYEVFFILHLYSVLSLDIMNNFQINLLQIVIP